MGRKATFVATLVERVSKNQEKLRTSEVLNSDLLDVGLLDLVRQPSGAVRGLCDHRDRALEHVHTLRPALAQANVRVTTRRSLEGRATRLLAREHLARILSVFHQHEVLFISHEVFLQ